VKLSALWNPLYVLLPGQQQPHSKNMQLLAITQLLAAAIPIQARQLGRSPAAHHSCHIEPCHMIDYVIIHVLCDYYKAALVREDWHQCWMEACLR
jgi:hypothetical protein